MSRFALLLTVSWLAGAGPLCLADGRPARPAEMDIEQLRRVVQADREKLRSLKAFSRSWYAENSGTDRYERCVVAAQGQRRYALMSHGEYADAESDPRSYIQIYGVGQWDVYSPHFRQYQVSKRFAVPPYTDKIRMNPFFESLGWWPPDDPSAPVRVQERKVFVHDILSDPKCRVVGQEEVDGVWCHLAELPGLDRLWIDGRRGAVIRREVNTDAGVPLATIALGDFRQVADGLELPHRVERTFLLPQRRVVVTTIDRYEVNSVDDGTFSFTPPPGTLIVDRDTDAFRQVPGGFEVMGRVADWVRTSVRNGGDLEGSRGEPRPWAIGWMAAGAVLYWPARAAADKLTAARRLRPAC
jgi:hypothetical protein